MFADLSQQTLDLLNKIDVTALNKTTLSQATGLNAFDLRGPALNLYPVLTPLRNKLPREVSDRGDLATRWKAVTGVNTTNLDLGLSPGQRSGEIQITEQDYVASYAGIGLESSVDWEAIWAGGKEFDNKATVIQALLRAVMIGEESLLLNGNASMALGTPAAPGNVTVLTNQGSMTAQAGNLLFVVALTPRGYLNATIAGGVPTTVTRTNKDGSTTGPFGGGSSNMSAASAAFTTTGSNLGVSATVTAVPGAAGYAWYTGLAAATAKLAAITSVNVVTILANPAGTQTASQITADNSTNSLVFDGFITQALKNGVGYFKSLDNAFLTSDGAAGIVEIDTALQFFWDNRRLSPNEIWINSQEARNINKRVIAGGGVPLFRLTIPSGPNGDEPTIMGGTSVARYWNKFTQQFLDIMIHPNITPGTILFKTNEIPYPLSGVGEVNFVRCRRDYYQIDWPIVSRQYVYGVYADEVLVCRAPFALGVIANVGNG